MWASWPAAWTAFSFQHIFFDTPDMIRSGLGFFNGCSPANEFVTCERSKIIPGLEYFW